MKLYTEDQVRMLDINCGNATLDEVIECLTPLELPSDEEIEKANGYAYFGKPNGEKFIAFNEGAKWMRNKIQGGKNDTI